MKNEKKYREQVFEKFQKYGIFWSISLEHKVENKPLISEECVNKMHSIFLRSKHRRNIRVSCIHAYFEASMVQKLFSKTNSSYFCDQFRSYFHNFKTFPLEFFLNHAGFKIGVRMCNVHVVCHCVLASSSLFPGRSASSLFRNKRFALKEMF